MMLLGVPAVLTVAKFAILAMAVVFAARGIFQPYGPATIPGNATTSAVRLRTPAPH